MSFHIAGIGTSLPPFTAHQQEAAEVAARFAHTDDRRARMLRLLYRKSGVHTRRAVSVRGGDQPLKERIPYYPPPKDESDLGPTTADRMRWYGEQARPLALQSATAALDDSGLNAADITHLVTVSCTGFDAPGVDAHLIEHLGLSRGVARTHVGFMGCHGAMNGLRTAGAYAGADPDARVLVNAVELCSLHFAYGWDEEMLVANTLFADGSASVVGHGGPAPSTDDGWTIRGHGSYLMPDSAEAMTWGIGDHGFRMTLSPRVPEAIREYLPGWLEQWLGRYGLTQNDVESWAVHPGGPRILDAVRDSLQIDESELTISRETLRDYGNMSSPTVLFILERLRREKRPRPCVALAFGPGLAVEAALVG